MRCPLLVLTEPLQVREVDVGAAAVLNSINGVLLTYRFGLTGSQEQFEYLRGVAVEMLLKAVDDSILGAEDPDAKLRELEELICRQATPRAPPPR